MSCHICSRTNSSRLPFYCPTCARSQLYLLRYETARILLEKDAVGREIEAAVTGNTPTHGGGESRQNPRWTIQAAQTEQARSSERTRAIRAQVEVLKKEIKEKKGEVNQRASTLRQRRSDAESANYQLAERRESALSSIQNSIKRTEHLWHSLHNKTAESRIFLCREAANIYGLRQKLRKRGNEITETYVIGGVPIVDLREMNGATPSQISTAFSNIAHLLILVSHYLSLRLPAEITLPHRNYPTPTIFTPAASYSSRDTLHSGKSPPHSLSSSPTASRAADTRRPPRPRPLSIDKPLPRLAKEDPATYALFVEGASLLAWNVSWLCRTQGLNVGSDSWEEICNIGKNMWQLLVAPPTQNLTVMRAVSGRDLQSKLKSGRDSPKTTIQRTKSFPMLGHYSHGTSHSFLGAAEGTEFMRTWKLPTPTKVADKLKSALLGEMANAEWELLEEREWDEEGREQAAVNAKGSSLSSGPGPGTEDEEADARTTEPECNSDVVESPKLQSDQRSPDRPKGTSGWTKLKSR
ncbi:hypothetical protein VTN77DRAFT_4895 [Rasamsonia byssochlamydoides]|uniref:uncharacterized protein n=1 Tax=Rasamsonia byssochlamydoides TaxID=89139 RepID=UPI00374235A0